MRDEVDDLVEAWGRERGDLDLAPVEVFSRISRLARHLDLARRDAFTAHGIESWEFDVLAALRRAGKPYELSPGRLLRETLVTSGTMTNRVDRLVARALVQRLPDPGDRRGVLVRLTEEGRRTVDGALEALLDREHELLGSLRGEERTRLADLLRGLLAEGVPIDGVGLQIHISATNRPSEGAIAANIQRLAALGLTVHISEMDVRINDTPGTEATRLELQRAAYRDVVRVCAQEPKCEAVTFWGFTDKHSWIHKHFGEDHPLLFNDKLQHKPAYQAVFRSLLGK